MASRHITTTRNRRWESPCTRLIPLAPHPSSTKHESRQGPSAVWYQRLFSTYKTV